MNSFGERRSGVAGAVDIGGTKIAVAAVDANDGRVIAREECPTSATPTPKGTVQLATGLLRRCQEKCGRFDGIGIGCTGPVDPVSGVVGDVALLPGWLGMPLADLFADEFGVEAAVENDADAAALAEAEWGAGRDAQRFIYVTISTGIGAGLVFAQKLYRGADGIHPEIGHHTVDDSGPLCYCGANGCWESLASGPALAADFERRRLADGGEAGQWTGKQVCDRARRGDALAVASVEQLARYFGVGLGNLMTIFHPDVIAVGGGLMGSADLFFEKACDVARRRSGLVPAERTTIRPAQLGHDAPLLGAAAAWKHRTNQLRMVETTGVL